LIAENDADAAISGVQIFVAAGLDREPKNGNGVAALVAECITRTPVDGRAVARRDRSERRQLSYTVDGRSVHYYFEARSEHLGPSSRCSQAARRARFFGATIAPARAVARRA
jgi:hypothetical protein